MKYLCLVYTTFRNLDFIPFSDECHTDWHLRYLSFCISESRRYRTRDLTRTDLQQIVILLILFSTVYVSIYHEVSTSPVPNLTILS
jgi:hypothetical protein